MTGKAEAVSHGAATIVNAIATGMGAAVGVDLWTKAARGNETKRLRRHAMA